MRCRDVYENSSIMCPHESIAVHTVLMATICHRCMMEPSSKPRAIAGGKPTHSRRYDPERVKCEGSQLSRAGATITHAMSPEINHQRVTRASTREQNTLWRTYDRPSTFTKGVWSLLSSPVGCRITPSIDDRHGRLGRYAALGSIAQEVYRYW